MLSTTSGRPAFSVSTYTTSIVTHSASAQASAVGRSRRTRTRFRSKKAPPPTLGKGYVARRDGMNRAANL